MKKTKTQKGITLIALIITIVVLLILAAVAISSITNDGILGHAQNAAGTYNQAVKNEQSMLQEYEDYLTGINGGFDAYTVGQEVKVVDKEGVEHAFYVIKDSAKTESKVLLLAKGNINTTTLKQENANEVAFSTGQYWSDEGGDIVEETMPIPESHIAAKAAYDYGVKVGGAGRLMTHDEESEWEFDSKLYETSFWLAYADSWHDVSYIDGNAEFMANDSYDSYYCGVRPVIEISKSKVTPVTAE